MGKQSLEVYTVPVIRGPGALRSAALPRIEVPEGHRVTLVILETGSQTVYLEVSQTGAVRILSPNMWTGPRPGFQVPAGQGSADLNTK